MQAQHSLGKHAGCKPRLAQPTTRVPRSSISMSAANQAAPDASTGQQGLADQGLALFERQVEGKKFFCTQCGKCCTGAGEVWLSPTDAERISAHLNLPLAKFAEVYCKSYRKYKGWYLLKNRPGTQDCIFLDGKLCSIHTVRPAQCSTYPWWPDLMDEEGWSWEKTNVCEGFDHPDAQPLDVKSAALQLQQATRDDQLRKLSRDDKTWRIADFFKGMSEP